MQFEVAPPALHEQVPAITRQAAGLAELASEVRTLAGVPGATGSPEAAAAVERFARVWSESVRLLASTVTALGTATDQAADAYTAVDAGVMPAGR
jgi:hypothetical protein